MLTKHWHGNLNSTAWFYIVSKPQNECQHYNMELKEISHGIWNYTGLILIDVVQTPIRCHIYTIIDSIPR